MGFRGGVEGNFMKRMLCLLLTCFDELALYTSGVLKAGTRDGVFAQCFY